MNKHSAFWCYLCKPYTWCPKNMGASWFLLRKILDQSCYHCQFHCLCSLLWTFLLKKLARGLVIQDFNNQESFFVEMKPACCCNYKNCKICCVFVFAFAYYVLHYQLMLRCLNFLPCCFHNSWLVLRNLFAEKVQLVWTIRRPEGIASKYAKKLFAHAELRIRLFVRLLRLKWKPALTVSYFQDNNSNTILRIL